MKTAQGRVPAPHCAVLADVAFDVAAVGAEAILIEIGHIVAAVQFARLALVEVVQGGAGARAVRGACGSDADFVASVFLVAIVDTRNHSFVAERVDPVLDGGRHHPVWKLEEFTPRRGIC